MEKYEEIRRLVRNAIIQMIIEARGTCVTFTPKKIAKRARLSTKPVMLSVIRHAIEELREKGVRLWNERQHGGGRIYRYIVTCDSPLWQEAKMIKEVMA